MFASSRAVAALGVLALGLALGAAVLATPPAPALAKPVAGGTCPGGTYTWTGADGTATWGTPGNWKLGDGSTPASAPGTGAGTEQVVLGAGATVVMGSNNVTICSLVLGAGAELTPPALDVSSKYTGGSDSLPVLTIVNSLSIAGGSATRPTALTGDDLSEVDAGSIAVTGGSVAINSALSSKTNMTLGAGARLQLEDASQVGADTITFGAGAVLSGDGWITANHAVLNGDASVLGVQFNMPVGLATRGHTLTVGAGALAAIAQDGAITSSPAGGVLRVASGGWLVTASNTSGSVRANNGHPLSIGRGAATLSLAPGGYLEGTIVWYSGAHPVMHLGTAKLVGEGTFAWSGGDISGLLRLGASLKVIVSGSAHRLVAASAGKTVLTNASARFRFTSGTVVLRGKGTSFVNKGVLAQSGGSFVAASAKVPPVLNAAGAIWKLRAKPGATIRVKGSFTNKGKLVIPAGVRFRVSGKLLSP